MPWRFLAETYLSGDYEALMLGVVTSAGAVLSQSVREQLEEAFLRDHEQLRSSESATQVRRSAPKAGGRSSLCSVGAPRC